MDLWEAISNSDYKAVKDWASLKNDVNAPMGDTVVTPLLHAAMTGDERTVQILLDAGAYIDLAVYRQPDRVITSKKEMFALKISSILSDNPRRNCKRVVELLERTMAARQQLVKHLENLLPHGIAQETGEYIVRVYSVGHNS